MDMEFPPVTASLIGGATEVDHVEDVLRKLEGGVAWRRGSTVATRLFGSRIHPNDVMQGQVGDCWLLAGIAAIAEFPDRIRGLFRESELSPTGEYHVRIFDHILRRWCWITVDDYFPFVRRGQQWKVLGAQPQDSELWVMLLEKACAKWFGSYAKMNGGFGLDTLMFLTDCHQCKAFTQAPNGRTFDVKDATMLHAQDRLSYQEIDVESIAAEQLYLELKRADEEDHIMVASTSKQPPPDAIRGYGPNGEAICTDGIARGHAYSLLGVQECFADGRDWRVVQLRNPWGAINGAEWTGMLSDTWQGWETHPELRAFLQICDNRFDEFALDGMFFMTWEDFLRRFSDAGIAYMPTSSTRQWAEHSKRPLVQWQPPPSMEVPEPTEEDEMLDEESTQKEEEEEPSTLSDTEAPTIKDSAEETDMAVETDLVAEPCATLTSPRTQAKVRRPLPPRPTHPPPLDDIEIKELPTLVCVASPAPAAAKEVLEVPSPMRRRRTQQRVEELVSELRLRESRSCVLGEVAKALLVDEA